MALRARVAINLRARDVSRAYYDAVTAIDAVDSTLGSMRDDREPASRCRQRHRRAGGNCQHAAAASAGQQHHVGHRTFVRSHRRDRIVVARRRPRCSSEASTRRLPSSRTSSRKSTMCCRTRCRRCESEWASRQVRRRPPFGHRHDDGCALPRNVRRCSFCLDRRDNA